MSKFFSTVVFSGNLPDLDVDRALAELTKAGYTVTRLPDALRAILDVPGDDFAEVSFEAPNAERAEDAFEEISAVVDQYGGALDPYDDAGPMQPDHVPFAWFEIPKVPRRTDVE
jgi:hypothetical protein